MYRGLSERKEIVLTSDKEACGGSGVSLEKLFRRWEKKCKS